MTAYIDYDCVLHNLLDVTLKFIQDEYGDNVAKEEIGYWKFFEKYPKVYDMFGDWSYYSKAKPIDGARAFLERLSQRHEVIIVTSTPDTIMKNKEDMIQRLYGDLIKEIVHTDKKHLFTKDGFLLDDALHHIEAHASHNGQPGIIFDLGYGWNAEPLERWYKNVHRARSYDEVFGILEILQEEAK